MNFSEIKTQAQYVLNDSNIFIETSELETVLNEAHRLACLASFCYEKLITSPDWVSDISAYQSLFPMPQDCVVPIYVYDTSTEERIHPVKLSQLELLGSDWESDTGTSYRFYCLFDPTFTPAHTSDGCIRNYKMLVYPKVNTTSLRIGMLYATSPATLSGDTDIPKTPNGFDEFFIDYSLFYGWSKRKGKNALKESLAAIQRFFVSVGKINNFMKSKYPQGRDFEPIPAELMMERYNVRFQVPREK